MDIKYFIYFLLKNKFFYLNLNFIYIFDVSIISVAKTGGSRGKRQIIMALMGWAKRVLQRG